MLINQSSQLCLWDLCLCWSFFVFFFFFEGRNLVFPWVTERGGFFPPPYKDVVLSSGLHGFRWKIFNISTHSPVYNGACTSSYFQQFFLYILSPVLWHVLVYLPLCSWITELLESVSLGTWLNLENFQALFIQKNFFSQKLHHLTWMWNLKKLNT